MRRETPLVVTLILFSLTFSGLTGQVFAGSGAFLEDNFNSYNTTYLSGQGNWGAGHGTKPEGFWVEEDATQGGYWGIGPFEGAKGVLQWSPIGSYYTEAQKNCTFPPDGSQKFDIAYKLTEPGPFAIVIQFQTNTGGRIIAVKVAGVGESPFTIGYVYYLNPDFNWICMGLADDWETWYTVEIQWRSSDTKARYKWGSNQWTGWVDRIAGTPTCINLSCQNADEDVTVWWDDFRVGDYTCYTPSKPSILNPANEATNVGLTTDLSWTAGAGATSHDVYFGTNPSPDSGEFQGNQTGTTFDTGTMSNNTTYYWRIDEKNACGTTTGDVWSFTTVQAGEIIEINSDITTNQLWTANNIYYVTDCVNIQALLVIEPGTMVIFDYDSYDCGLFVNNGGTLISKGTPDKPIIYTCDFMYYYPEDIGYYWCWIRDGCGPYYFSPIYIEETASPATTVTYNFIEGAFVGIATKNISLDHPIENNYLFGNLFGIGEYGPRHTDIKNNLCFCNYYSGIEVLLPTETASPTQILLLPSETIPVITAGITG